MRRTRVDPARRPFVDEVRALEQKLFASQLREDEPGMMKSEDRRFWHFRPSHHASTGLITEEDVVLLARGEGRRLLSVGAAPAFLERLLPELGVPPERIVVADDDPAVLTHAGPLTAVVFDACGEWPDIGTFDVIVFPESLCLAVGGAMLARGPTPEAGDREEMLRARDAIEAQLLTTLMRRAFERLRPGGVIRANGPMSHPAVNRAVSEVLWDEHPHELEQRRFFLSMRRA